MNFSLASQLRQEAKSVLSGYPEFVFKKEPMELGQNIPVFVFHTIDPLSFEAQLHFLKENNYRTLRADEFLEIIIKGKKDTGTKSLLLTIDDARSSFWRFGYPLLRKYDMNSTLFIIPGATRRSVKTRINLSDVWEGRSSLSEIQNLDPKDETLCTWTEIKDMYQSGLVDIESHTLFHKEVFISSTIQDFIDPDTSFIPYKTPITAYMKTEDSCLELDTKRYFGLPLYSSAPLLHGDAAIKTDEDILRFCREFYHKKKILYRMVNGKRR